MKIALLSVGTNVFSNLRIIEEANKGGHLIQLIDQGKCMLKWGLGTPQVWFQNEDITHKFNVIIPRIGITFASYGASVVKQFEMARVLCLAPSQGIAIANDKAITLQVLAGIGIPVPATLLAIDPMDIDERIAAVSGPPVIIKLREGTQGLGVMLAETHQSARSIVDTLLKLNTPILLQEYISEANGEDIRAFVVGNKIVASMKRTSKIGEFRSNLHRGGSAVSVALSPEEEFMVIETTKRIGLAVAGVDLIRSKKGPLVLEVNASPGLQGIEDATGVNVAKAIIDHAAHQYYGE